MPPVGPFSGPVPPDVLKKVSAVVPRVELSDVRLIGLACQLKQSAPDDGANVELSQQAKSDPIDDRLLGVQVEFALNAKTPGESGQTFFVMRATFQLLYEGEQIHDIDEETRLAFANVNGVFNAWPYLRELVQSITGRMSIPALIVPLLKIQPSADRGTRKPAESGAPSPESPSSSR